MLHPTSVILPILLAVAAAYGQGGILQPLPRNQWDRAAAAHLLARAGFGATPEQIERCYALGLAGAVDALLNYDALTYTPPPPELPSIIRQAPGRTIVTMNPEQRREAAQERIRAERIGHQEIRLWWLERMVQSPRPLEEKMTLFWHGHFTSGAREVRRAQFMLEQNELLRRHALGDFRSLLLGISRDRAMLVYLDNARNRRQQPNENYARELLELFTLGEGQYTEADVKAAARAFTGWTFDDDGFVFRRAQHDDGPKTFLGKTGRLGGEDVIDQILAHPACSRHLARKLAEFFVTPEPERELVERLAAQLRRHNYALKPVLRTLFLSRAFYAPQVRGALVKSPVELIVGTARRLGVPIERLRDAERTLAALGQELMQPPNVKGWNGGSHWINTATLHLRYNAIGNLIQGDGEGRRLARPAAHDEDIADDDSPESTMAGPGMRASGVGGRSRLTAGRQTAYDPLSVLKARNLTTPGEIVDFYCAHLLARPLSAAKRQALMDYLDQEGRFHVAAREAATQIRQMIHLLCSTPEFQMH